MIIIFFPMSTVIVLVNVLHSQRQEQIQGKSATMCHYLPGTRTQWYSIVSIVTIPHIVVCENMNYTFMAILQSDNAMLSCVEDLLVPTFLCENEKNLTYADMMVTHFISVPSSLSFV